MAFASKKSIKKKRMATAGAILMALTIMHLADKASGEEPPVCEVGHSIPPVTRPCAPGETPIITPTTIITGLPLCPPGVAANSCIAQTAVTMLPPPVESTTAPPTAVVTSAVVCPPGQTLITFEDHSSKCDDGSYYATTSTAVAKQGPPKGASEPTKVRSRHNEQTTTTVIEEDDPRFDCLTMGNKVCGAPSLVEVPPLAEPWVEG